MNVNDLRNIIREEVSKAVEQTFERKFREVLTEAVEIASRPSQHPKMNSNPVVERKTEDIRMSGLNELLQDTYKSMTRQDYAAIMGSAENAGVSSSIVEDMQSSRTPNTVGELPSFVKNAKAIFDASNNVDKSRHGI